MNAGAASRVMDRNAREASRAALNERICQHEMALRAFPTFPGALLRERRIRTMGGRAVHGKMWARIPPMRKAPTHVPIQTTVASFAPRSFSMTMREATQGTKSVIVTSATTT
jgi:hypothetical protein